VPTARLRSVIPARRHVLPLLGAAALAGAGALAAGCGGADGTPASTTKAGLAVYDAQHNVVNLTSGPKFVIVLPEPPAGARWQLVGQENVGGITLQGMQRANGGGQWTFATTGAGSGTLEFQQVVAGSDDATDEQDYEVNIQ